MLCPCTLHFFVLFQVHLYLAVSRGRVFPRDSKIVHAITNYLICIIDKISLCLTIFGIEYQDCSKANISCDKYRYFFKDALNIAHHWGIYTGALKVKYSVVLANYFQWLYLNPYSKYLKQ